MITLLLLLVCVVACKSIDTISSLNIEGLDTTTTSDGGIIDERELAYNDRHEELASRFRRGDPAVTRRIITHTPTKRPSARKPSRKPTRKPTTRKPTTRKPTTRKPTTRNPTTRNPTTRNPTTRNPTTRNPTTGSSILPIGTIFEDATGNVNKIDTATQYTTYSSNGRCTTWPYYQGAGNIFMTAFDTLVLSKNGNKIVGIDMKDKTNTTFTILNNNPYANKCIAAKSNFDTYSNIVDTFKQGDAFQRGDTLISVSSITANAFVQTAYYTENQNGVDVNVCYSWKTDIIGPFILGDGYKKFVSKASTGSLSIKSVSRGGTLYGPTPFTKISSIPPSATCPGTGTTTTTNDLFVNKITYTDLTASSYNGGLIVNDDMIFYDWNSFNGACTTGKVLKVNLNTGSVTNTTYIVNYNDQSTAGYPVYYDGTHLWLKPKCGSGDTLVATTTATTKSYSSSLANNGQGTYAKVNGIEYLYWYDSNEREVYSYNINAVVKSSLNLKSQLQQQLGFQYYGRMVVYNNKLLFVPWNEEQPFIAYDLATSQFSKLGSDDWKPIMMDRAVCYSCLGGNMLVSNGNMIVFAARPKDALDFVSGWTFITVGSTPSRQKTPATITAPVTVYNRAAGAYYTFSPTGSYNSYHGIYNTDVAIECKQGLYSRVDDYHILLGGDYTYFAKSTNTFTIGTDEYDVISDSKLPKKCLPLVKASVVSFTKLTTDDFFNNFNYAYSSSKSNKIVLYGDEINVYNAGDNTVGPYTVAPPPKPTNPSQLMQAPNGRYYYPVSIKTELDYWLYQDYNAGNCKLVSSTNSTDVITIPGNYYCFNGYVATGNGGDIYGFDTTSGSIITVNIDTQQVTNKLPLPITDVDSLAYLGNNKLLVYNENVFIVNVLTNTYESFTGYFDSIIPSDCREDFEMMAIGSTSSGVVGYVNCYSMDTDASIKFTLN